MTVHALPRFGTERRHGVREQVYDSLITGQVVRGDDIEELRIELGLLDLTDRQVGEALNALKWKHRLISLRRPHIGRVTRGWVVRKLGD